MKKRNKVLVYVIFKDGYGQIVEYNLENNLSFSWNEMKKWIKEQSKKPIKSITLLKRIK